MKKYAVKHFSCQLLDEQTRNPIVFVRDSLSFRENLQFKELQTLFQERDIVYYTHKQFATMWKCGISAVQVFLNKLRDLNILRWRQRWNSSCVYQLNEFYALPKVTELFRNFYKVFMNIGVYLFSRKQLQEDQRLIRIKVSYLYNSTLNRMRDRRFARAEKPERRSFSPIGETYGANEPGQTFARLSFEEFDERFFRKESMKRISGGNFDEFCRIEELLHEGILSGRINPQAGQMPNFFANRVTPLEKEFGLSVHLNCSCRQSIDNSNQPVPKRHDLKPDFSYLPQRDSIVSSDAPFNSLEDFDEILD